MMSRDSRSFKPGQRIGKLTVVREAGKDKWGSIKFEFRCDCGNTCIQTGRSVRQQLRPSCGCDRRSGDWFKSRRMIGERLGSLTVAEIIKNDRGDLLCVCDCDCGNAILKSPGSFRASQKRQVFPNCGDRTKHPEGQLLRYPESPKPYPEESAKIVQKYMKTQKRNTYPEEDCLRMDALMRSAWVITYRRSQGESISEPMEKGIILKALRFASHTAKIRAIIPTYRQLKGGRTAMVERQQTLTEQSVATASDMPAFPKKKNRKFKRC